MSALHVPAARRVPRPEATADARPNGAPGAVFLLIVAFMILEYARPPVLPQFRLQFVITLVMPILWLARVGERPWSKLLTLEVAFLALCALAVPIASNNYAAYIVTRKMFGNVSIAIGISWIFSDRRYLRRGVWTWVLIMGYVATWSLAFGGRGPGGFLGDENDLALACLTAFPLAFFGFQMGSGWVRWVSAGLAVLFVCAVVNSFSRGGFIGLVAVLVYCFLASRHKIRTLLLASVGIVAFVTFAPAKYIEEIKTIQETSTGTAKGRRFLWTTAYNMWKAQPVLGVGGANFSYQAGRYQPLDWEGAEYQERDWSGTTMHSAYFEVLADQGLVGTVIAVWFMVAYFRLLRRLRRTASRSRQWPDDLRREVVLLASGLSGAMVGYLSAGTFLSVAYYPYPWYFAGIAVALATMVERETSAAADSDEASADSA